MLRMWRNSREWSRRHYNWDGDSGCERREPDEKKEQEQQRRRRR